MCGILAKDRGHFGVANRARPFYGDHPRVPLEVPGCGEAGDVPFEIVLMPAGFSLAAIYEESVDLRRLSFKPLKKTSHSFKESVALL